MSRFIAQLEATKEIISRLEKIEPGCPEAATIIEIHASYLLIPVGEVISKNEQLTSELEMKVQRIYQDFLLRRTGYKIFELVKRAQDRINLYGEQGGYGHHVYGVYTHHYVIPVDKYESCKFSPEEEFALAMCKTGLRIAETPEQEIWGN